MAFDYKKEYREFYLPKDEPGIVDVPAMNFAAVRGAGDPNAQDGEYQRAIGLLYGVAYTLKLSHKSGHLMEGYFDYVVPPLEGLWWQEGVEGVSGVGGVDYARKEDFRWISLIRLPDFVTQADLDWAVEEAGRKKKQDFGAVQWLTYSEGLCVQCMHIGPYDSEPATIKAMEEYAAGLGYAVDITGSRLHHEIYLSDARRVSAEKLKTVIRHPVRKA